MSKSKPIKLGLNRKKTLNNILCLMNDEIKITKESIESSDKLASQAIRRTAIENIAMLSNSYKAISDGDC